jgi:membrane-bound lytic murein transglycosylase D
MNRSGRASGRSVSLLLAIGLCAGCATSRNTTTPVSAAAPSPETEARRLSTAWFEAGRRAALAGDFPCAAVAFDHAVDAVAPPGRPPSRDPETAAFSRDLWDSIQRYEALSGPAEEAGNADGQLAPEVELAIEEAHPSAETIERAREAVSTDVAGATNDLPVVVNEQVLRVLSVFQWEVKDVITRGLSRSGRYLPMIHRILEEEGLPKDLAYLPIIESSFLPHANSYASAHGIWQFMPRTGRHYGLSSNAVVDERADPEKATRAAARYLSYLHGLFGDWYLALAAYNAGEGKILRAMQRTGAKDFWQLAQTSAIRAQTKNYVPAFLAATLIAKNPLHYGFEVEYESPLAYETITLDRPVKLTDLVSDAVDADALKRLNPELRTSVTPKQPEGYSLKVPPGQTNAVWLAYASAPTATVPTYKRHTVKKGQTLKSIARRYGVTTSSLAAANGLSTRARLQRGRILLVPQKEKVVTASKRPKKTSGSTRVAAASKPAAKRPASTAKSYRVKGGDTLYGIARRHGVTVESLQDANNLYSADIKAGQRLTIPVESR